MTDNHSHDHRGDASEGDEPARDDLHAAYLSGAISKTDLVKKIYGG